jgi:copper chaperone CopZ
MREKFEVANVKCGGCANTVTTELEKKGFKDVSVDLEVDPRQVSVTFTEDANEELFRTTIRKLGYPCTDEQMGSFTSGTLKAKSFVSCAVGKMNNSKES